PALRTVAALSVWGGLKLSGRQWSGWQVWCCCLAAIIFADPALRTVAALSVWGGLKLSGRQWSGWQVWCCCLA
ncbi:hypothetical protein V5H41_29300, partial [Salmonella enterica]